MKLLTKELRKQLPKLYATEDVEDKVLVCKFFYPDFSWTWYAVEFDGDDLFFGLVDGDERELGYFTLSELTSNRGALGCAIERDRWFTPCKMSELPPRCGA